ncbi:MAG TPA: N,N-dimethylformamidase beta subunit family domain-containing protein [Acidobacteriota bacterium]|nr:N,N-dimethylformamidase beta subunit family domain-containing protein [Acidobacteriota bacterium]
MKKPQYRTVNRRQMIREVAVSGAVLSSAGRVLAQSTSNPIVVENQKPGTTDWQLTYIRSRNYRSQMLEGFCSHTSIKAGETLDFFISADRSTDVVIDIFRTGYYGGKGGRFMQRLGPFSVSPQTTPPIAEHRLRQCEWERTARLVIPNDWLSGVYLGKLSCEAHRYQSYVIFIVRDDRQADLMFQCSDTTWQAYNKWPDEYSLYDSDEPQQPHSSRTWVSFDRPYGWYPQVVDQPLSQGSGEYLLWEFQLAYWLEQHGYDVTYVSNIDTHKDPEGLKRTKCFLSVGHDEYWTLDMFHNVKNAVADGLNAAFLSGNALMWAIALEPAADLSSVRIDRRTGLTMAGKRPPARPNPSRSPHRIIYRVGRFGNVMPSEEETGIMGPFEGDFPNENTLIGARTVYPFNGSADWIVTKADHWIFEGTGMKNGDRIPGLVGWEFHGDPADLPGLEVIAEGIPITSGDRTSHYTATVYPGPRNNWVFNASTIFWSVGLSTPPGVVIPYSHHGRPHGPDERVQRITSNFLARVGAAPSA